MQTLYLSPTDCRAWYDIVRTIHDTATGKTWDETDYQLRGLPGQVAEFWQRELQREVGHSVDYFLGNGETTHIVQAVGMIRQG